MKKEVVVGLMTFAVDESKAEEFEKSLKGDFAQIDYVRIRGFNAHDARANAIKENCDKFGAEII